MKLCFLLLLCVVPIALTARNSDIESSPKRFVVHDEWQSDSGADSRSRSIDGGRDNNDRVGGWGNSGSSRRPDTSSNSRPFGNNQNIGNRGSIGSRPTSSSSSLGSSSRRTTERPYGTSESHNNRDGNNHNRDNRPSVGSSSSSSGATTTPKPEDRGLLSTLFGKPKNVTTVGGAIATGNRQIIGDTIKTFMTTVNSCIGSRTQGWMDPELGNFTVGKDSPYCNKACLRNFFCCPPMKPDEIEAKFIFSDTKRDHKVLRLNDQNARRLLDRNRNRKIVWVIHGLINDIYIEPIFNQTRDAYIDRGFNVIVVDWSKGNRLYMQAMANVRTVGALTGQLMDHYGLEDRSICAGFSLGSHICGEAGTFLKRRRKLLYKCHGIDPAGPGYDGCSSDIRLDKGDCGIVTAIHTSQFTSANSLLGEQGLGTKVKSGHCDFWPNDGQAQPRCDNSSITNLGKYLFTGKLGKVGSEFENLMTCSHWRGMNYYLSQLQKRCFFVGREGACGGGAACSRAGNLTQDTRSGRRTRDIDDFDSTDRRNRRPGGGGRDQDTGLGDGSFGVGSGRGWGNSGSGSDGRRRPGSSSGFGANEGGDRWSGSSGSGSSRPSSGSGDNWGSSGGGRRPGSGSGFGSGNSGRPGFGSGGDRRPDFGSEDEFGSGSGNRPGGSGSSGWGSSGNRPTGGFGSGSRPGSGSGFGSGEDSSGSGFGSSSQNRPSSGSGWGSSSGGNRPGSGSGFGSGGNNRPGSSGHDDDDTGSGFGSSSGNRPGSGSGWGSSSSGRPTSGHGSSSRPNQGNRPSGSGSGEGGNNENEEDGGSWGRPPIQGTGNNRPTGGQGNRPSGGNGNRPTGGASTWTQGDDLKEEMPLSPDDVCDQRYDYDYKFETTGREPFC